MAKLLTLLTNHKAKFDWTPTHHTAFMMLKEAIIQAPNLCYPDPARWHIVYTDASDDARGAQLSQGHDGTKFPRAFLSHTSTETQRKWSTPEKKTYKVDHAITKCHYYLQRDDIIVHNDHKPLAKFLNEKKSLQQGEQMGTGTYNLQHHIQIDLGSMEHGHWLPSRLEKLPNDSNTTIRMLTGTISDRPAFNTRSKTSHKGKTTMNTEPSNTQPDNETVTPDLTTVKTTQDVTPKPLMQDRHEAMLQMQKTDPFCKHISKQLSNGKASKHEANLFTHIKELIYKHIMNANQKFTALIIPKAWKYMVLVEAHDKLGHRGVTCTYCLTKWKHYWKEWTRTSRNT